MIDLEKRSSLEGKTLIITRAKTQQSETRIGFESLGAKVLDLPSLVIGPPDEWGPLDDALSDIGSFHWIIFSSINGVEAVNNRLKLINSSLKSIPISLKIAAVGKKTAKYLLDLGVNVDFTPPNFIADSLIKEFPVSGYGLKMLIPRVQTGGRTLLAESFAKSGARVIEVPAYESRCPDEIPEPTLNALSNQKVDIMAFTSSKTAKYTAQLLEKYFGENWLQIISNIKIVSIGPQTSISCKKHFNRLDKEAKPYDLEGLIEACVNVFL